MTLDIEFRQIVQNNIQTFLTLLSESSKNQSYLKKVWKYEHESDFRYGYIVGFLQGSSIMLFKLTYDRATTEDERTEIKEIIESNARQIRENIFKEK